MFTSFTIIINIAAFISLGNKEDEVPSAILFVLGICFIWFLYCVYRVEKTIAFVKTWRQGGYGCL